MPNALRWEMMIIRVLLIFAYFIYLIFSPSHQREFYRILLGFSIGGKSLFFRQMPSFIFLSLRVTLPLREAQYLKVWDLLVHFACDAPLEITLSENLIDLRQHRKLARRTSKNKRSSLISCESFSLEDFFEIRSNLLKTMTERENCIHNCRAVFGQVCYTKANLGVLQDAATDADLNREK